MKHRLADVEELVLRFIDGEGAFDETLRHVATYQRDHIPPLAAFWKRRDFDPETATPETTPAVPTEVFRHARLVSAERKVARLFRTSGTTAGPRGESARLSVRCYDASARAHFDRCIPATVPKPVFLSLVFDPAAARDSSLSHMVGVLAEHRSDLPPRFFLDPVDGLDIPTVVGALRDTSGPVVLFATAYALANLLDAVTEAIPLPPGSVIVETGGFKGRRTSVDAASLYQRTTTTFRLPSSAVRTEYSMTELSSQLYSEPTEPVSARRLVAPPWCRVIAVDPETAEPLPPGDVGLLRFIDLANVDTVVAVQTSDLGHVHENGSVTLLGRAAGATPRGCGLAAEEVLAHLNRRSSRPDDL